MPWEIRIKNSDPAQPLGTRADVRSWLSAALPGVDLQLPPAPPEEFYAMFSPETREEMKNNRNLEGLYEEDDFTIEFYCSNETAISCLHADVRGNGNPLPALAKLCMPKGWTVLSSADGSHVDLTADAASQWQTFCSYRDDAIDSIDDSDD